MRDDQRGQFIMAQQLIEEGRRDEALRLLYLLEEYQAAREWAAQLERGEPVDTDAYYWEPDMVRPMPSRLPERRTVPVAQVAFRLLLALMLLSPVLQMLMLGRGGGPPPERTQQRVEARLRVQGLCNTLVAEAIAERRLQTAFGSCLDWSLSLTNAHMRAVTRCHERFPGNNSAFRNCAVAADVLPAMLLPRGQPV